MRKLSKYLQISVYNTNDPFLESIIGPLDVDKIEKNFTKNMEILRMAAAKDKVVSLAANQIRMQHRVFAILKQKHIVAGQWSGYECQPEDY